MEEYVMEVVNEMQILGEKILNLEPENRQIIISIVNQFLIAEAAVKLGVRPVELKQLVKNGEELTI